MGATPLWTASFSGHQKCMELLIDAGANVDVLNKVNYIHTFQSCMVHRYLSYIYSRVCIEATHAARIEYIRLVTLV